MNDWVFYLWIGIISLIAILLILFGIFPLAALLPSLRAMCFGRYLNRYFIVQRRKNGSYTLHHNPMLFYYSCSERKFYRLLMDAIRKFKKAIRIKSFWHRLLHSNPLSVRVKSSPTEESTCGDTVYLAAF